MAEVDASASDASGTRPTPVPQAASPKQDSSQSFDQMFPEQPEKSSSAAPAPQSTFDQMFPPQGEHMVPLSSQDWSNYLHAGTTGAIIRAFGDAFTGPGLSEQLEEPLKKLGWYRDYQEKGQQDADGFGQGVMRGLANGIRTDFEAIARPVVAGADVMMRAGQFLVSDLPAELGQAAEETNPWGGASPLGRWLGLKRLGRDVAGMGEQLMTTGEIAPRLPHPVARARVSATIGEGEAGYFGTGKTTDADVTARAAAAGDMPHEHTIEATEAAQTGKVPLPETREMPPEPTAPPDIHAVARQVAPEVFAQYDPLVAQRETLAGWMRELPAQTEANIEAKPPQPLQDLDAEIAKTERKIENAGARTRGDFEQHLDDLHEQRADMMADLVRNHPDVAAVRANLQRVDYAMRDLAPEVSRAYRDAEAKMPPPEAVPEPATAPPAAEPAQPAIQEPVGVQVGTTEPAAAGVEPVKQDVETGHETKVSGPVSSPEMVEKIAQDVAVRLEALGRPADEAAEAGRLVAAHYEARAQRFGGALGSAQELYWTDMPDLRQGQPRAARPKGRATAFAQVNRGLYTFATRVSRAVVHLFRDANASTFLHETSHHWLEELLRDAEHEHAPADLKADAATARAWLKAETGPVKTAQHEKWARGFERYMMEGRAPSKALAGVFEKFRQWLTAIYQTVAKLRSPINDDIRDVFDRLLAHPVERAIVAPELPLESGLADRHEGLLKTGTPDDAHRVHVETAAEAQAKAKEIVDELRLRRGESAGEAGGGAPQHTGGPGGGDATGNKPGPDVGVSEPGAQLPGRGGAATAGLGPERPAAVGPNRQQGLYARVPKRPPTLIDWIKARGGIKDERGDVKAVLAGSKRAGVVKATGESPDDLALLAHEAGFFPESPERPTVAEFLNKLEQDARGTEPVFSEFNDADVAAYKAALGQNAEVDRIASELQIEANGLTHAEFWNTVADRMSAEQRAALIQEQAESHIAEMAEADDRSEEWLANRPESWEPDAAPGQEPRTLEDLERERRSEEATRGKIESAPNAERAGPAAGSAGTVQEGGGSRRRGAEPAGRPEPAGPAGEPVGRVGPIPDDVARGQASGLGKAGHNPDAPFETDESGKDLAGNIRLENLATTDDVDDLLRAWAQQRNDLMDARHNEESYRGQLEVEAARALLCDVAASTLEAEKKLAAEPSEANAVALMQWRDRLDMVGDKVATLAAGAGRTLAAFRRMEGAKEIMARLEGRTLNQLVEQAKLNSALNTPGQLAHAVRQQLATPWQTTRSRIIEYYVNNLISGPITHSAYMIGNLVTALTKATIELPLAAGVRAAREVWVGHAVEGPHLAEAKAMWLSLGKGFADGFPAAWEALKTGVPGLLEGEDVAPQLPYQLGGKGQHAIPGLLGDILNAPSHVVVGIHTLSRTVNYEMEKAALIANQVTREGLTGESWNRRVAALDQSPGRAIMDQAAAEATHMVMMDRAKWGTVTAKVAALSNSFLPLKIALPFVQIGVNLLHGGLVERTPLSLFEQAARDDLRGLNGARARYIRAGKIATGMAIGTGVVALASQDLITGGEPSNPHEAALWRAAGKQAYSVRVGDYWVPYRKWLGWFGPLVGMTANMYQVGRDLDDHGLTAAGTAALFGFSEVVGDESWFRGVSDFVNAAKHWDTEGEKYIRNLGTNFIPFSVGLSQVAHLVDPYQRRANGFMDEALRKMPGLSEGLHPAIDIFGEPIPSHMQITPTRVNPDRVIGAMQQVEVWPRQVDKKIRGVTLTPDQYEDYARTAGKLLHDRLAGRVAQPGWDSAPGHVRRDIVIDTIRWSREQARGVVMAKSHGAANDIMALAHGAKTAERAEFDTK